jgi:hypothetical protein
MSNFKNTLVTTVLMHKALPRGARRMLESAAFHGIDVTPFGQDRRWENYYIRKVVRFFEWARHLRQYDYIVFSDGDDVLYATGLGELHHQFATYGGGFVMSGEHYCWPFRRLGAELPHQGHRFKNPCAGFYMATWPAFLATFEKLLNLPPPHQPGVRSRIGRCDQGRFQYAYAKGLIDIEVDVHCRLCQSLNGLDGRWTPACNDIEWGKRPRNKLTRSFPCVFHANGGSKWRLPELWDLLRG